jgi:predicted aldo/keto reductase-like oxidoreductase
MKMMRNLWSRRKFLRNSSKSLAAVGVAIPIIKKRMDSKILNNNQESQGKLSLEYRILGRTGLKVTTVAYGAMRTRDHAVIHRALDLGLNYIDTARIYMDGYNEEVVGKVMKTRRKEVFIATKTLPDLETENELMASLEKSLISLNTDYVDVIQLHNLKEVDQIKNEECMKTLEKMKKQGKARFIGFTTHRNQTELVQEATKMGFYDIILVGYNFKSPDDLGIAIKKAALENIGIVGMKTQAGGYEDHKLGAYTPHQAALKWVLQNTGVATTIPSMVTYAQLDEDIQAMNGQMGWNDRKSLYRYGKAIDKTLCRMCDSCTSMCPRGVDVLDVNRCLMYANGYDDFELASGTFHGISRNRQPVICRDCTSCSVRCPFGLDVRKNMLQALTLFT